jgi:hypothetical protein
MRYRPYTVKDKGRILEIFRSNCPKYFRLEDEVSLIHFLDNYADTNFLVVVDQGIIVGCGGHYTTADKHGIAWVMFERNALGTGHFYNTCDAFYSILESNILKENSGLDIYINTTQLMEQLFRRYGFSTYESISDGFGQGLDEVRMRKVIESGLE